MLSLLLLLLHVATFSGSPLIVRLGASRASVRALCRLEGHWRIRGQALRHISCVSVGVRSNSASGHALRGWLQLQRGRGLKSWALSVWPRAATMLRPTA